VPPKTLELQVFMDARLCRAGHRGGGVNLAKIGILWKEGRGRSGCRRIQQEDHCDKAFGRRPTSDDQSKLVESSIESSGASPRFLVTDHGIQFWSEFRASIESLGITHVRCQVRTWQLNAKVERVFKDVKA